MKSLDYHELSVLAQTSVETALVNSEVINTATMYCGTLFVTCNAYSAYKIKEQLVKDLIDSGRAGTDPLVRVSKVGPEYAFDFVA